MNNAVERPQAQPVEAPGTANVVDMRGGEVLPELEEQPLPSEADVEVVVAKRVSIRVQVREARLASRSMTRAEPGWWSCERWAPVFVVLGLGLVGVAGVLGLVG